MSIYNAGLSKMYPYGYAGCQPDDNLCRGFSRVCLGDNLFMVVSSDELAHFIKVFLAFAGPFDLLLLGKRELLSKKVRR